MKKKGKPIDSKLPRAVSTTRGCQELSQDGYRCLHRAKWEVYIFENPEHGDNGNAGWFTVLLCPEHAGDRIK